jgi:glycine oxidase
MSQPAQSVRSSPDVIVVGGGVIGLSIAWELAGQGVSVRLLEQGQLGQESSWAGAGMLIPGNPRQAKTPEARLRAESHVLWSDWSERLRAETGIDNGYSRCGGLEVRSHGSATELDDEIATWRDEGVVVESFHREELVRRFPSLNPEVSSGYLLPELGQVRNPRHLKGLIAACASRGVDLRPGSPVVAIERQNERIVSIRTIADQHHATEFVIAAGAWSHELLRQAGQGLKIEPIRGQMVLLEMRPLLFHCVIQAGLRYLVPRADGRILIGSTEEQAGFEKGNTAEGVAGLIEFACGLVPQLRTAQFERCWSGLRPYSASGLPHIGRLPGIDNLSVAAGHFRAGLMLSPVTAVKIADLILRRASKATS